MPPNRTRPGIARRGRQRDPEPRLESHPETSEDSCQHRLADGHDRLEALRAFARSARVPELPYTNLTRALWSRYRNASTTTEVFGPRLEGFCLSSSGTRWCF